MGSVTSLRTKAAEIHRLAETSVDVAIRAQLVDLAEQYERLATSVEYVTRARPRPDDGVASRSS